MVCAEKPRLHAMSSSIRVLLLLLTALGLLTLTTDLRPVAASSSTVPIAGPVAGPIEVFTEAEIVPSPLGNLLETTLIVENHGSDPVLVLLIGQVAWPNGSSQMLRYGQPMAIAPNGALILSALSAIPADAGSGTGSFTATAFVCAIGHGGRGGYPGRLIAQDSSSFVLP